MGKKGKRIEKYVGNIMDNVRKCDTCIYNMYDYKGNYCGCSMNSEYGLYSIYGWCEHYEADIKMISEDKSEKKTRFYIKDMDLSCNEPLSKDEMENLLHKALKSIGVVPLHGDLN
ncbi:hypothetical protein [Oribacterium sp. WCC10]|uniref:hypothetical protein n=1 Tax=Oribacterium sp. WCC10 TaxID=1855343 RepID=UPI0008EC4543|nr:hypothetical protein [Oribacterium sp. WCC10]SFG67261.1 hypothetical protein SAMN05216356_11836 [Oribacterium sp. WCC10]